MVPVFDTPKRRRRRCPWSDVQDEGSVVGDLWGGGRFASVSSSLGIDGGQMFQIFAIQTLGLSSVAIGFAFGLGVVSTPIQIAAARFGLHRAGRNLRLFVSLAAVQVAVLAFLTFRGRGGTAAAALGVTVLAEITLSVLFATSWQPLLAVWLSPTDRQFMNSIVSAAATIVLAAAVLGFASLNQTVRGVFLVGVTVMTAALAVSLRRVGSPRRDTASCSTQVRATLASLWRVALAVRCDRLCERRSDAAIPHLRALSMACTRRPVGRSHDANPAR